MCLACDADYPVHDGIPVFLKSGSSGQENERNFRDRHAAAQAGRDERALLDIVARHHSIPVMRERAAAFHAGLGASEWLADIGVGYGWHWTRVKAGARILGIDLSLGNLRLAKRLLHDSDRVALVCADAGALPVRSGAVSGIWSVQTFQHFPDHLLRRALGEIERVLGPKSVIEIYGLNPALLHRILYRVAGKRLHQRGRVGEMELNRLSAREFKAAWHGFRGGASRISTGYSELFFHPDLGFCPAHYPVKLERLLAEKAPGLAALFARQVQVRIESQGIG